jgi:hypothetical protein
MRNSCDHLTATLTTPISFLESAGSYISIGERRFPNHATPREQIEEMPQRIPMELTNCQGPEDVR